MFPSERFCHLIFPCLLKRMVLPLIMKTEKNFKLVKVLKFTQFCNFKRDLGKISVLTAQAFEAKDFLNIFLWFWSFGGSFSYKNLSYEKYTCIYLIYNKISFSIVCNSFFPSLRNCKIIHNVNRKRNYVLSKVN